jgi:GT2 family glycosyltransferase
MLRIVAATSYDQMTFQRRALLAGALRRLSSREGEVKADVIYQNNRGLPEVYNEALSTCEDSDLVLFVHDDVRLDDWFLPERLKEALANFDLVGILGNRRRVPGQVAWHTVDREALDKENLSGSIANVNRPETIVRYGDSPCEVKLLVGLFLAARAGRLREAKVGFDPQFPSYFYDFDFCRACELAGLKLGTWPIATTAAGESTFDNPEWKETSVKYLAKWGE